MTDIKELKEEELEKITGGASVNTLGGYSRGNSHELRYSNNSGFLEITIEDIDDSSYSPFYVKLEYKRSNHQIYNTDYSYFTLSDMNYYWGKTSLG